VVFRQPNVAQPRFWLLCIPHQLFTNDWCKKHSFANKLKHFPRKLKPCFFAKTLKRFLCKWIIKSTQTKTFFSHASHFWPVRISSVHTKFQIDLMEGLHLSYFPKHSTQIDINGSSGSQKSKWKSKWVTPYLKSGPLYGAQNFTTQATAQPQATSFTHQLTLSEKENSLNMNEMITYKRHTTIGHKITKYKHFTSTL